MTSHEKEYLRLRAQHHYEKYCLFTNELSKIAEIPSSSIKSPMDKKEYWKRWKCTANKARYHRRRYHTLLKEAGD